MVIRGYAICTSPRSGSNLLCDLLTGSGVLGRPQEYLNGPAMRRFEDPAYPRDPREKVRRVLISGTTPNGVYGVKLFPFHHDTIAQHVSWTSELPNLSLVYLERRDLLGQAISLARALQTRSWKSSDLAAGQPDYSSAGILRCLSLLVTTNSRWVMYFARNGVNPVHLVYEDLVDAPQAAVDQVASLMNLLEPALIRPDKISPKMQRDELTEEWRARFLAEHRRLDRIDPFGVATMSASGADSQQDRKADGGPASLKPLPSRRVPAGRG